MSKKITFLPSQHTFEQQGRTNLLEAALSSGFSPDYGCNSGNCGRCKVTLVSGDVEKVKNHDYVLSAKDKASNSFLLCAYAATCDSEILVSEALSAADIPEQQITAKVKSVKPVEEGITLVSLQTPRSKTLRFLAGQQIRLSCEGLGTRDFYIGSCPCDDRNLQLHVLDGITPSHKKVSECLAEINQIEITGPFGDFNLREDPPRKAIFICLDEGFAPVKSLIEHAIALEYEKPIRLFRYSQSSEKPYLHNLCRSWADALDDFHYQRHTLAQIPESEAQLKSEISADEPVSCYLAGSQEFVDQMQTQLMQWAPELDLQIAVID